MDIIGRLQEMKELKKLMDTNRSEFIVIYGRRRVGKTYLIKNFFDHQFSFYSTGITSNKLESQLSNFNAALKMNPVYNVHC